MRDRRRAARAWPGGAGGPRARGCSSAWWARAPRAARRRARAPPAAVQADADAMRAAAAEVQFEPPEPRPRQSDGTGHAATTQSARCRNVPRSVPRTPSYHQDASRQRLVQLGGKRALADHLVNCRVSEHGRNDSSRPPWGKHNPRVVRGTPPGQQSTPILPLLAGSRGGERVARRDRQKTADVVSVDLPPPLRRAPSSKQRRRAPPLGAPVSVAFQRPGGVLR